jgi:VIT1/CCC1 family predicted Fe2+/Mn2+ transporter
LVASILQPEELDSMRQRLQALPEPPERARLGADDWLGAGGVFLLVFLTTFPVAVPFIFMQNTLWAMRVSNLIAIVMLLGAGIAYGRSVGRSPWGFGIGMVILGAVLVALTMALGG